MADDAAAVLASQTPPNTNELGDSMTAPPPTVPTNELGDPLASIQPTATPAQTPQTTPASQDPEMVMGAAHQSEMAKILHAVGGLLGGDKTYRATPQKDGTIKISSDPSTTGEEWKRIAAEALGGAAKGLAVGQGPGGAARAASAGIQTGLDAQKNERDAVNKDVEAQQQIMMRSAQNARLNQQVVAGSFNNSHMERDDLQAQADRARANQKELGDQGYTPLLMNVKDPKVIAQYGIANPLAVDAHLGKNGDMIYAEPNGTGGVNIYHLPAESGAMPTLNPTAGEMWSLDPDDMTKPLKKTQFNIPAGTKKKDVATQMMALNVANDNAAKARSEAIVAKQNADTKKATEEDTARKTDSEIAAAEARAGASWSEATLNKSKNEVIQNTLKKQPGGEATEVEDPNFPSPNNFPVGTLGIAKPPKSGDYKTPAEAERAYRLSQIMQDSGNLIRQTATSNPQLFGKFQGLLSQGKTVVGLSNSKDDQALATLAGAIQQYSQASAGFHTFRNKAAPAETEESALRKFRNDPASVVAYLDSQKPALTQTERLIKNYQVYGTPQGPSEEARQAAVMRAPNAAKFANPGGQQQPPPGAAISNGKGGVLPQPLPTGEIRTDQQGNHVQLQGNKWVQVAAPATR